VRGEPVISSLDVTRMAPGMLVLRRMVGEEGGGVGGMIGGESRFRFGVGCEEGEIEGGEEDGIVYSMVGGT
jgi:hypothetical protein